MEAKIRTVYDEHKSRYGYKCITTALLRIYAGIKDKGWCTAEQYHWIGRRVAELNKWPILDSFLDR